jgi:membrane protease YdiL (CAAX protease family)
MWAETWQGLRTGVVTLILTAIIPLVWWLIFYRKKERFDRFLGLKKPELKAPVWALIVFLLVYAAYYFKGDVLLLPLMGEVPEALETGAGDGVPGIGWIGVPGVLFKTLIGNGLGEETLFRGFLLKRFQVHIGTWAAIILSASLFAVMHNILHLAVGTSTEFRFHLFIFVVTVIPGLLFGFLNEKLLNGAIWISVLLHGVGNAYSNITALFT